MAELDFEIHGKHGEISATTFREAIYYAVALLREYDAALTGKRRGTLGWYIRKLDSNGSLAIRFESKLRPALERQKPSRRPPDVGPSVASHLLTGFEDIEQKCETPPYLSEYGLEKTDSLVRLIGRNGAKGFRFASQSKSVEVTRSASENLQKLIPIARTAIGTVEGKLEGIILHGKPRFIVYHAITKKAVSCLFDDEVLMEVVKNSLGKRVSVFGKLFKNIKGDTLRVSVQRLTEIDEANRFAVEPMAGEPEFTEALNTEDYLRRVRGR